MPNLENMDYPEEVNGYKVKHQKIVCCCDKPEDTILVMRVPKDYDYISLKIVKKNCKELNNKQKD